MHESSFHTDGLAMTWTTDRYRLTPVDSVGEFALSISHQRTLPTRIVADRPNLTVYSPRDASIERFYREDLVRETCYAPVMKINRVKDFELAWTIPDLVQVFDGAELSGMLYNPVYLRDVYERDGEASS